MKKAIRVCYNKADFLKALEEGFNIIEIIPEEPYCYLMHKDEGNDEDFPPAREERIVATKKVRFAEVEELVKQGWKVYNMYQNHAVMVKEEEEDE